ncbi:PREDICTED: uncharacterized protein LOC104606286 [Nelumbo nucifera]|uniref:Uncharacterized protein LOC104606286 n=1 Tax=Nelumbo nucifera TaxID=4432 RepID=A0A1U8B1B8_NELNU|nr:PREDICTED: uncharacterized protein LOC104606286 [Nelumbo nucifera]
MEPEKTLGRSGWARDNLLQCKLGNQLRCNTSHILYLCETVKGIILLSSVLVYRFYLLQKEDTTDERNSVEEEKGMSQLRIGRFRFVFKEKSSELNMKRESISMVVNGDLEAKPSSVIKWLELEFAGGKSSFYPFCQLLLQKTNEPFIPVDGLKLTQVMLSKCRI